MDQQIILAIREQRVLSLLYEGRATDFEPYTYGRMISGKVFLFGWQRTGLFAAWRVLSPHRARDIRLTEATFQAPRPGYSPLSIGQVAAIYAQIEGVPGPALTGQREQD